MFRAPWHGVYTTQDGPTANRCASVGIDPLLFSLAIKWLQILDNRDRQLSTASCLLDGDRGESRQRLWARL